MHDPSKVLVTLADHSYIEQAKQIFSSAVHCSGWNGDLLLLSHSIPRTSLQWFVERGICVHECDTLFTSRTRWQSVVFSKYYLFSVKMKQWRQVVFVEGDAMIQSSVEHLTGTVGFAAVATPFSAEKAWRDHFHQQPAGLYEKLLSENSRSGLFFNSGVMAFSTEIIGDDTFNDLIALTKIYLPICKLPEQAILNIYFRKTWSAVDPRYNLLRNLLTRELSTEVRREYLDAVLCRNAAILHFSGTSEKPWHWDNPYHGKWRANLSLADAIRVSAL